MTICLPGNASPERRALLEVYGAEVIVTDRLEGTEGAARRARELADAEPDRYFYADQYGNPANPQAHRETTGPEIWTQTGGRITHFVAAMGTTGTMMGTGGYLKERNPGVTLVGVQPDSPFHGLEGLKHLRHHVAAAGAVRSVGARRRGRDRHGDRGSTRPAGWRGARAIWSGWSAGAAVAAALDILARRARRVRGGRSAAIPAPAI